MSDAVCKWVRGWCAATAAVLSLTPSASAGGSNACAGATSIVGAGPFDFDNSAATTDGLEDLLCDVFGSLQVDNDVWFAWTSDCDGSVTVATCGGTAVDTKIAVYDAACGGPALGCNDDSCGLQSTVGFVAICGNVYLIRIGTFPGAAGGTGTFTVSCVGCGGGGCGDCDVPGGAPGCSDPTCERLVCAVDAFCCSNAWDGICAGLAADLCDCDGDAVCGSDDCQDFLTDNATRSASVAFTVADDFRIDVPGAVSEVCWWGAYLPAAAADTFTIRYYADAGGMPGALEGGPFTQPATLTVTGPTDTGALIDGLVPIWAYSATHASVPLAAGCHWIEIRNDPAGGAEWFWSWGSGGNNLVALDAGVDGYDADDVGGGFDTAFCLDITLGDPGDCDVGANVLLFSDPLTFTAAGPGISMAEGDFNNDGLPDIVIAVTSLAPLEAGPAGNVQVFLNNGTNPSDVWLGLTALTPEPAGNSPTGVTAGLFDLGGFSDVAVSNADGNVTVLFNDESGNGTLDPPVAFGVGNLPSSVSSGDYGNDGHDDIVVTNFDDDTLQILTFDPGMMTFLVGGPIDTPDGPRSSDPTDWDDDECLDLAIVAETANQAAGYQNDGAGGLLPLLPPVDVGLAPIDVASADFDGVNNDDIVTANAIDGTVSIALNTGALGFSAAVDVIVGDDANSVVAEDLEAIDTDPDLGVLADGAVIDEAVQVLSLNAGTDFGSPFPVDAEDGVELVDLITVDVNGDGALDLVTVNLGPDPGGGSVTVWLNETCVADPNRDGITDVNDLVTVIEKWGTTDPLADVTNDGIVNVNDLVEVIVFWGGCQ